MNSYALSELSALIQEAIEMEFSETYWVRAEIASIVERGGHLYIDLVEKGQREVVVARHRAICWGQIQVMLQAYFEQETGSRLQVGMQVLLEVEIHYHAVYGLSLTIVGIDPRYTLGDMARQRQETIRRLKDEGIVDMQQTLTLPTLTRRVAVISSETAAGYGDFCDQLHASPYRFRTTLFAAIMQGEKAEQSIIAALGAIMEQEAAYDVVVIIRGGGATTDLSCFDGYLLCAHCAQFPLPIISGIGHTKDVSILDMVAYKSLKTPTAVADFLIGRLEQQSLRLRELQQRISITAQRQILLRRQRLEQLRQRLCYTNERFLLHKKHLLTLYKQRLDTSSPERIYRRGYSLLTCQGRVVHSVRDVQKGDLLVSYLQDGSIQSIAE